MRSKGWTEVREAVDHALAVPSDYGPALVQGEILQLTSMGQIRKGSSDESKNKVPTVKEPLSKQWVALWMWPVVGGGLGAREWGDGWGDTGVLSFLTPDVFS